MNTETQLPRLPISLQTPIRAAIMALCSPSRPPSQLADQPPAPATAWRRSRSLASICRLPQVSAPHMNA